MVACPLSGQPSTRVVQVIPVKSLTRYWRFIGGARVAELYRGIDRLELRGGAEGLLFYHPLVAGDAAFYRAMYRRLATSRWIQAYRRECELAAALVPPGARVLDVGAGFGAFGRWLSHARYTGIDLTYEAADADPRAGGLDIRRQSLEDHAAERPVPYDVVSAFHVVEHVTDPRGFVAGLASLTRPGGQVIIGLPRYPSPMTEIPAFPVNMPPHHLTFWTAPALERLARETGLVPERIEEVAHGRAEDIIFWIRRFSWTRCGEDMARLDRHAIASLVVAGLAGQAVARWRRWRPGPGDATNLLMVARKP